MLCILIGIYNFEVQVQLQILSGTEAKHVTSCTPRFSDLPPAPPSHCFVLLKFSFSEKATKICAIFLVVLTFTKCQLFWEYLSKCQNHEQECKIFCGLLKKAELYCVKPFYFSQITDKVVVTIVCYAIAEHPKLVYFCTKN